MASQPDASVGPVSCSAVGDSLGQPAVSATSPFLFCLSMIHPRRGMPLSPWQKLILWLFSGTTGLM